MKKAIKEVIEKPMKFYFNEEDAQADRYVLIPVECEGNISPHSVIKTVLRDRTEVIGIGENIGALNASNLASAKFQLVSLHRDTPADITFYESVYIFESFLE